MQRTAVNARRSSRFAASCTRRHRSRPPRRLAPWDWSSPAAPGSAWAMHQSQLGPGAPPGGTATAPHLRGPGAPGIQAAVPRWGRRPRTQKLAQGPGLAAATAVRPRLSLERAPGRGSEGASISSRADTARPPVPVPAGHHLPRHWATSVPGSSAGSVSHRRCTPERPPPPSAAGSERGSKSRLRTEQLCNSH